MSRALKNATCAADLPDEYHVLSDWVVGAIRGYAFRREGYHGDFIEAVMSNDLQGAFAHADSANQRTMLQIVRLVYNHCPRDCHGSKAEYEQWLGSCYIDVSMKGKPPQVLLAPFSPRRVEEKPELVELWLATNMPAEYEGHEEDVVWASADERVLQ